MRKLAFLLLFVAGSTSAATPSASKTALVNELMELTHGGDTGMNAFVGAGGAGVRRRRPHQDARRPCRAADGIATERARDVLQVGRGEGVLRRAGGREA